MKENFKEFKDRVNKLYNLDFEPLTLLDREIIRTFKDLSSYLIDKEIVETNTIESESIRIFQNPQTALITAECTICAGKRKVIIKLGPLIYFSKEDEDVFVHWLKMIKCIEKIEFMGPEVQVVCSSNEISFKDKTNFNGIFTRYTLDGYDQLFAFKDFKKQFVDNT